MGRGSRRLVTNRGVARDLVSKGAEFVDGEFAWINANTQDESMIVAAAPW